jgi:hypothetical protein
MLVQIVKSGTVMVGGGVVLGTANDHRPFSPLQWYITQSSRTLESLMGFVTDGVRLQIKIYLERFF